MNEAERYAQYLICKQRGHVAYPEVLVWDGYKLTDKKICRHCEVNFWYEVKEDNVPTKPEET